MSATSRRRSLPRIVTFVVSAVAYNAVMAAAGAVSPLLITYQQEWRFPAWQLTAAFSVYPLTLLLSLLVVGGLSDFVGRKPLLIAALVIQLAAVILFLTSGNIWGITLARAIQGVAAGIATSTFSPYLNEVSPRRLQKTASIVVAIAPLGGLGIGAILAGVAIQFVSDPASVVFLVALVLFAYTLALLLFGEETATSVRGAAASLVPRIRIPQAARAQFATVAPGLVGVWMSAGLMLGLVASIAEAEFYISGGVVNGVIVALQPIAASVATIFIGPRIKAQKLVPLGYVTVIAGVAMAAAAFEWAVVAVRRSGGDRGRVGLGLLRRSAHPGATDEGARTGGALLCRLPRRIRRLRGADDRRRFPRRRRRTHRRRTRAFRGDRRRDRDRADRLQRPRLTPSEDPFRIGGAFRGARPSRDAPRQPI